MTQRLKLETLSPGRPDEEREWDRFVKSSPDGTVFHLIAWKRLVEEVFHYRPLYLRAKRGSEIREIIPLFEIRGLLTGSILVSVPKASYGGLCGADAAAREALLCEVERYAERHRIAYVELRNHNRPVPDVPVTVRLSTFVKHLDPDPSVNFASIPRKRRQTIAKGIRRNLEARRGWQPLREFYRVYAFHRRRLGSPPFSRRFFEAIASQMGDQAELLTIWHDGRLVAGVISLFYQDRVMPYYGASTTSALSLAANDFMYWDLMRNSSLIGCRLFDFGVSQENSGSYHFKRLWGFEPTVLPYQYLPVRSGRLSRIAYGGEPPRVFSRVWRRMPLSLTTLIGPALIRRLPLH